MNLWNNLNTLWLLCVVSMAGIIGMILVDGVWDIVLLIVAALPIILAILIHLFGTALRVYLEQKQERERQERAEAERAERERQETERRREAEQQA